MKITLRELRQIVKGTLSEAAGGGFFVTDPDGKRYVGSRDEVRQALVRHSKADAAERDEVMATGRASSSVVSALKRAKAIKAYTAPEDRASRSALSNERFKSASGGVFTGPKDRARLERAYRSASNSFAAQYRDFLLDHPEANPADVALDAASEFFREYPEWSEWAQALKLTKHGMQGAIADIVHDAMVGSGNSTR